jgi:4-alpha-glucanotransferase
MDRSMTTDETIVALAGHAGLEVQWRDAKGEPRTVGLDTLRAVLKALALPVDTDADICESSERLNRNQRVIPPLQIVRAGEPVRVMDCRRAELVRPDGTRAAIRAQPVGGGEGMFRAPRQFGYYKIECNGQVFGVAVVPGRCVKPEDIVAGRKLAGVSVQIYSLRGGASGAFGDFAALASVARDAGNAGVDAIMVSPTHALFGADAGRFSPYSPSTRFFFNPLFADTSLEGLPPGDDTGGELIDWQRAGPAKYVQLRDAFARFRERGNRDAFMQFCREGGDRLRAHALFEALDLKFRRQGIIGFRNWPEDFQGPNSVGATVYAREANEEIEFQLFLQWLTAQSVSAAQSVARGSMAIGIIADIAVGMDPHGSHAWSAPEELLRDLNVGAPPDIFNMRGQDWGLTGFSPWSLRESGFASFIDTLRANMAHAGGVRIDHVLGMRRLWVLPAGALPNEGVYLRNPQRELLGLTALESRLHRSIVVGEDLGTVPDGFRDELAEAGVLGMQVLWFERDVSGKFVSPGKWRRHAVAKTTTHDLPTVIGWWSGQDIDVQRQLGLLRRTEEEERGDRAADRKHLSSAFRRAKLATRSNSPSDDEETTVINALRFIGKSRCSLAIAPIEDIAGERDQPNVPGTIAEHPNWRRRMKHQDLFRDEAARRRLEVFVSARNAK